MSVGTLEEIIDDNHAIVSASVGPQFYVSIMSFVDKDQIEPGCTVLLHHKVRSNTPSEPCPAQTHTFGQAMAVVGLLNDDVDPMVNVMKVDKAPLESYADVGGLDSQIQEVKVCL